MKIIGASLGECVHIQGVWSAMEMAKKHEYDTQFLGPAMSIDQLVSAIKREQPDAVALSYRLTSETGEALLAQLSDRLSAEGLDNLDYLFGGTPPVAEKARATGLFDVVIDNADITEFTNYLTGSRQENGSDYTPPQRITERIQWKKPRPLLRTHYGQPNMEATIEGIKHIADSRLIDIISLGTDQDAQANFFHKERQVVSRAGAGGVPVRSPEDFSRLFEATRTGNHPLMRTYAGTDDLVQLAEMYEQTFGNAWSAVPIFWFNDMDGRGPHTLNESVKAHFDLIKYNAENDIPVEILEAHHWGMRWAHDTVQVASAVLGAEITKALGGREYIHQYMFHLPPTSSFTNELAKMIAVQEIITKLEDKDFTVYHQTRAGLPSFPCDMEAARGQLASSTMLQMQLKPDIVHVVNYSEPHHAATYEDVIASAKIVNQTIDNALGAPSMRGNREVLFRKIQLQQQAGQLLNYIQEGGDITDPVYVASIVTSGLFDAPMLINNSYARGIVRTAMINGGCEAVDDKGMILDERERIKQLQ